MRNNDTILVVGGAGYIGSHVCKRLRLDGYTPITFDNLSNGNKWAVKWGPFEKGDILDSFRIKEVIKKYNPVAIMHFAAFAYVGESVKHPYKYFQNNVIGSLNLIKSCLDMKIQNFIFSSSCAVYGPKKNKIDEKTTTNPINPYGKSKLFVEEMLKDISYSSKLNFVSLRYFNAFGADPDGEIGENHEPETHIIPLIVKAALEQNNLTIFGNDYDTPDGTCIRDFIHVSDIANAHLKALKFLNNNKENLIVNLGTGKGNSILEIIKECENILEKKIQYKFGKRREGDPARLIADGTLAKTQLNWIPEIMSLKTALTHVISWEHKN